MPRTILIPPHAAAFLLVMLNAATAVSASRDRGETPQQWRPSEWSFQSSRDYADPFAPGEVRFNGLFEGPGGERFDVPGFWDGDRTWRLRFTPTRPGKWNYTTRCSATDDPGLAGKTGQFVAAAAHGENPIDRHGGFLRVSNDRRYLTYTDGTPLFWLGDTWWCCPSANVPLEAFKQMVDRRAAQGYTVFQAHGHRPIFPEPDPEAKPTFAPEKGIGALDAVREKGTATLRYWREVDRYIEYAHRKGMIGVVGFSGHRLLDPVSLEHLQRLWRYYLARYGAYGVTFLITQEYNARMGQVDLRVPKLLALGRFISRLDPYGRAMTVHPWWHGGDGRQAWGEPWCDFIMLQAGHRRFAKAAYYEAIYRRSPPKPLLESEANYEGFRSATFTVDAAAVRRSAYTAIQGGSFGFTYGAQGLYAGVLDRELPGPTARWGPVLTWQQGLALEGGRQMQHLRACYEMVDWWKLHPLPGAVRPPSDVLAKGDADRSFLLYYTAGGRVADGARLAGARPGAAYVATWFDPRTGRTTALQPDLRAEEAGLRLPPRPDTLDWVLLLERREANGR